MTTQHNKTRREVELAERRALRKRITALLRRFYKAVIDKGVPERFNGLINRKVNEPSDRKSKSVW